MGMSNAELHSHFLRKAEEFEARATRRKEQIRAAEQRELHIRWNAQKGFFKDRNFEHELAHIVSSATSKDPLFNSVVEDHKWYMQKAIMYGIATNTELLVQMLQSMPIHTSTQIVGR
jgi:neutral trehalase